MKKYLFLAVALLFVVSSVFGADAYYQGTVTKTETFSSVGLKWVIALGTDSTGSKHSPAIKIADVNDADALVYAICNAASDINVIYHFSIDGVTWVSSTPAGLDACSNTAKNDTLGTEAGANLFHFERALYMIIEADGQTGANTTDQLTLEIGFKKDQNFINSGRRVDLVEVFTSKPGGWTNP